MAAETIHGPSPRNAKASEKKTKPAAVTLEKPKRGRKKLVRATPRVLQKYWEVKKKPAWASVSDHRWEKEGRTGPSRVVMTPIRMKLTWSRSQSLRASCRGGDVVGEA